MDRHFTASDAGFQRRLLTSDSTDTQCSWWIEHGRFPWRSLWFTGVIRDRLGDWEDRFCFTFFLGSSTISIQLLYIWGATTGAMLGIVAAANQLIL